MLKSLVRPARLCALGGTCLCWNHSSGVVHSAPSSAPAVSADHMKKLVGYKSVDQYVRSGMKVGLGTGSTAFFAVERVGQKLKSGELRDIVCVPTSEKTASQAREWNIPLTTLDDLSGSGSGSGSDSHLLDLTIDGADEVELNSFTAIKGGGGALLREKMIEKASKQFVCIVDESKFLPAKDIKLRCVTAAVKGFGSRFPIPIEIIPFNHHTIMRQINEVPLLQTSQCRAILRRNADRSVYVTDNGNYIADLLLKTPLVNVSRGCPLLRNYSRVGVDSLVGLSEELYEITGLVEHGLFVHMIDVLIVAHKDQTVEVIETGRRVDPAVKG